MASLRVCAITFDWYPFDVLVRRTAEAAVSAGYSSDVICIREPGQKAEEICDGVHVYRIPMSRSFGRSLPFTVLEWTIFMIQAGIKVARLHLKHRYDVIHVHNMPDFLVFSALVPKLMGAKVILEIQDVSPELMAAKAGSRLRKLILPLATWQERISAWFAHHIVTVGWPFERLLLKRGIPSLKITNILNSADPRLFPVERSTEISTEAPDEENPLILMYHGTVAKRNGLDTALRAVAQAQSVAPYIRLDIKGRGEAIPSLKLLAHELGISEYVRFSDPCPSEELVDFVLHGDVGIIPYRSDGFMDLVLPTKAYEFALMRRPMIASDTPAIRSMFRPESLILCEPTNVDSFAAAIIDLYQHPEKRLQMVNKAAQDYRPYRWEVMAERYQQLLLTLAQKEGNQAELVNIS
ncbi:MAG: glycosyltransferase family 4 protein [Ktedonobacteraceae bacterium]|nr:glycosyltransferase family 4 protein [Ktedonobacteraceae bacterium]